jgi:hypothetical protein
LVGGGPELTGFLKPSFVHVLLAVVADLHFLLLVRGHAVGINAVRVLEKGVLRGVGLDILPPRFLPATWYQMHRLFGRLRGAVIIGAVVLSVDAVDLRVRVARAGIILLDLHGNLVGKNLEAILLESRG